MRTFRYRGRADRPRGEAARGPRDREVTALNGVSLHVDRGEIHGLLGPNGAGKTTLVKVLSTVLLPTSGRARVFGHDVVAATAAVRARIGIVFGGERGLYGRLTARQNLAYWAALYRLGRAETRHRVDDSLRLLGLSGQEDTPVDRMSRGMKQRLHLARGLLSRPDLLFLDEPTVGMDPVSTREFREIVAGLRARRLTVLLTTHDMAEAEALCDRVTLIDRGRVLGTERPRAIGRWLSAYERVELKAGAEVLGRLGGLAGVGELEPLPDGWTRAHTTSADAVLPVLRLLVAEGVTAVRVTQPGLEEVYLRLIGDRGLQV
ncbi:ABC transporter ATP-binding protein [Virgisporangium aurantiacum]|uniref:Daunorubicin resistance protein DrrA family ABC transporter ATP-binding protein n=1 Tax=Virgisporangium aurantiacum TaxID=175570 RepID=A0A8J3ZG68_9ACTN|nr:ABC transporter ATP-binding protein [Virgisporangium aurantiacum]GIJ62208.1 daunorubicin resistance protein DrrA family ABC transporter ATP-binding protein [Virgisporangium aurantiacum]